VALAPLGKALKQMRVGRLILRHSDESGVHGAGLGKRKACAEA